MGQLILAGLAIIALKLIWDVYQDYQNKNRNKTKKGQVIDLSEAWIDMDNLPYQKKDSLLSRTELTLFHLLKDTIDPEKFVVLPKVRLEDIMSSSPNAHNAEEHLYRLKERSVDFLICSLPDLKPQLVVFSEGTDSKKKQLSDRFNKKASEEAGIPIMSLNIASLPSPSELAQNLMKMGVN
ncbi:MAG: DUF2726 domain-containing protein [Syntrophomonadaceae bacterium]|nr:DUF2726 domain-containing protein [Syntrophomonadaceae bacterium]